MLGQMGAEPGRALMVGDSETDVAVARNAGVPVAVVDFGYTARLFALVMLECPLLDGPTCPGCQRGRASSQT